MTISIENAQLAKLPCPSCGAVDGMPVYEVSNVPVHSVLLMESRDEAIRYPRADILLVFCRACEFIFNAAFDESVHEYSAQYEETQHFSACFNSFAERLVRKLIDQYDVRRKTVLDIGCGKGEFLALLCEQGDNRGVGIDPACAPERLSQEAMSRVEFIREFYSEEHMQIAADMICCRHTLEHIQPTLKFLQLVRKSIKDRYETLVFFEVPNAAPIFREQRFWDIYYEHCSYFNADSLSRLFTMCGFEILEVQFDYDDQYLLLVARPRRESRATLVPGHGQARPALKDVEQFQTKCPSKIDHWHRKLTQLRQEGKRVAVWGAGSKCVSFLTTLGNGAEVEQVVDINPHKQGNYLPGTGHCVLAPESLGNESPDVVIVVNPIYRNEIDQRLQEIGVACDLLPLI